MISTSTALNPSMSDLMKTESLNNLNLTILKLRQPSAGLLLACVAAAALFLGQSAKAQIAEVDFGMHPTNQTLLEGQDFTLSIAVTGEPPISVQWYKGDEPIPSATHLTFPVINANVEDSGNYHAIAYNAFSIATSDVAVVEIQIGDFGPEVHFHETFETSQALDDWSWDGPWEIGVPTSGPNVGYNSEKVAGTVLAGDYTDDTSGRMMSPSFTVPAAVNNPRLRWAQWYAFNSSDSGQLQIQVGGGEWTDVAGYPTLTGSGSGAWSEAEVDLSAYAGQSVRIGFLLTSSVTGTGSDRVRVGPGWYVDEVTVVTGPTLLGNPEGFEGSWDGWYVEGGSWEVGMPTGGVGPGQSHTGTQCAGTVLGGDYADGFGFVGANFGRLVCPAFMVPPAVTNPRLRFWNWHDFNSDDLGQLQIRVGTDNWQTLATYTQTTSGAWSRPEVSLSAYAGQSVRIGFLFTSSITGTGSDRVRVGPGCMLTKSACCMILPWLHSMRLWLERKPRFACLWELPPVRRPPRLPSPCNLPKGR